MRKLFLLFLFFLCLTLKAEGQIMSVIDVGAIAEITSVVEQTTNTVINLEKQLDLAKKVAEKTQKVTNAIKTVSTISRIIDKGRYSVQNAEKLITLLKSPELSPDYIATMTRQSNNLISNINNAINLTADFLTDNKFDLTDKDRMDGISDLLKEIEYQNIQLDRLYRTTQNAIIKTQLLKIF